MAFSPEITAEYLKQRLAVTAIPDDPLDVVLPAGSELWPADTRERLTESLTPAGILIPVMQHDPGGLTLLLTQRSAGLRHHAGQVSFPGGRMEACDGDIAATALRETAEEVGITPGQVHIIGFLRPMPTVTGFAVTPVIGLVDHAAEPAIDLTEVESAFEVPLAFLVDPGNRRLVERQLHGSLVAMAEYHFEGRRIWGATAFIIESFIKRII
jgi:8-oxo-dGTP pyrophosphatase MutT (NUDIX family)